MPPSLPTQDDFYNDDGSSMSSSNPGIQVDLAALYLYGEGTTTPPNLEVLEASGTTPMKIRSSNSHNVERGTLLNRRQKLASDTGPIPEYPVEDVIEAFLPPVSKASTIYPTRQELIDNGVYTTDDHWKLFPIDPSDSPLNENEYFSPLGELYTNIIKCCKTRLRKRGIIVPIVPSVELLTTPHMIPENDRGNLCRPDFQLVLAKARRRTTNFHAGPTTHYFDIVCAGEVKMKSSKKDNFDNRMKVLSSGYFIMQNDITRRFVYAITIENLYMRIWLFARTGVMVSRPFNWMAQPILLCKVFVAFALANEATLGYSPCMRPILVGKSVLTEITLGEEQYVTTGEVLSDFRARRCSGRGTRVLVVRRLGVENAPKRALKIYWPPVSDVLESALNANLREKAENRGMDPNKFLLDIRRSGIFSWDERIVEDEEPTQVVQDESSRFIRNLINTPSKPVSYLIWNPGLDEYESTDDYIPETEGPIQQAVGGVPGLSAALSPENEILVTRRKRELRKIQPFHFRHRRQVFLLFSEVGIVLHDVRNLVTLFLALREGIKALWCLHELGYVHRDISSGNLLMYRGTTKLMDLEYLRKIYPPKDKKPPAEYRTGTAQYIATEVQSSRYYFTKYPTIRLETYFALRPHNTARVEDWLTWAHFKDFNAAVHITHVQKRIQRQSSQSALNATDLSAISGQNALTVARSSGERNALSDAIKDVQFMEKNHKVVPFRYNTLHDVESCVWILLWVFFHHVPVTFNSKMQDSSGQLKLAHLIFPEEPGPLSAERLHIFTDPSTLKNMWSTMPEEYKTAQKYALLAVQVVANGHRFLQQYSPVLPRAEFTEYQALIVLLNKLANDARLEFDLKFTSVWLEKANFAEELEHRPTFELDPQTEDL